MTKTQRFFDCCLDIDRLTTRITTYLQEHSFEVAISKDKGNPPSWCFIQARKNGILRTTTGTRRSINISINGTPDNIEIEIGTGEWGKNLLSSAPLFVIPVIGIAATLTKFYTAKRFESNLWRYIKEQIIHLKDSCAINSKEYFTKSDFRKYQCDYVEGYPGWDLPNIGGMLVLEHKKNEKHRVVFTSSDSREIVFSAEGIIKASIISRQKGLNEHDLMIEIIYKDKDGKTIQPVFNLNDAIITGVLAGINELVAEDAYLKNLYKSH
ncbi:hypothetical protein [Candidatus Nitrosotenuis chungbukensis]|uniref:hypothetical protein n=1 Tax=Candidatus Nitrosotenuis chungbukensis TaxID=1353246 RepID=UPI0012FED04A|nr:hypothetical protein [Candidatus Nitrosotenuis chungbukensis]